MKRFQSLDTSENRREVREMKTRKEGLCVARLAEQGGEGVYFPRMSWAMEGL